MKGKSKKLPTLRSNSTKKLTMRNKSHPGHEINLEKMFAQMKSDILNEMKKVAEIKFNEHKVNILKLLNKSQVTPTPKKKVRPPTKSEKKEKKGKISSDDDITYIGTETLNPKTKDKNNKTPSKVDKQQSIHLIETPRSRNNATDPKLPKKSKPRKKSKSDNVAFLGNKRKRGKENFVNLSSNNSEKKASSVKKKKVTNQAKKPSIKKKGK